MPIERKRIKKPFLLLCEGRDAEGFLINYLNSNELAQDPRFSNFTLIFLPAMNTLPCRLAQHQELEPLTGTVTN